MKRSALKRMMVANVGLAAAILLGFGWLGYLGGDPFTILRPDSYQTRPGGVVAVLLSGDMGFNIGMGPDVAARLQRDGVPVVGVNSLTYFRTTRTAAQAAALVEEAMRRALAINPRARLVLIGQSYGADMLHVGLSDLPAALRSRIGMVALVVPGATVEYRASPSELLTFAMPEADALPTARRLDWAPLLCIQGVEESASLCPLLRQPNLTAVALPGGHPLHRDVDAVYRTIRSAMDRAGLSIGR
jgi:type IV secretory pathway VirJ component